MSILGPHPNLLDALGLGPAVCVFTSPPGGSDAPSSLRSATVHELSLSALMCLMVDACRCKITLSLPVLNFLRSLQTQSVCDFPLPLFLFPKRELSSQRHWSPVQGEWHLAGCTASTGIGQGPPAAGLVSYVPLSLIPVVPRWPVALGFVCLVFSSPLALSALSPPRHPTRVRNPGCLPPTTPGCDGCSEQLALGPAT